MFYKSIPLTALLFTGFAAGGIAQDTSTNPDSDSTPQTTTAQAEALQSY